MGRDSKIEWCHHTFNPWIGCQRVSPGCQRCYAEALVKRAPALVHGTGYRSEARHLLPTWGPKAPRRVTSAANWDRPLKWNREAEKAGGRRRVFCASMADVFEDWPGTVSVPDPDMILADLDDIRGKLWALIERTPHLDWLLLTKRPENVYDMVPDNWIHTEGCLVRLRGGCGGTCDVWPRNVWVGCTVEDQRRAEERIPRLLEIPSALLFVSYEPALGPVNWLPALGADENGERCACGDPECPGPGSRGCNARRISWLIVGGESGPGARPFDLAWARQALADCKAAGVPVFVKQTGSNPRGHHDDLWALDGIMPEGCGHYTHRLRDKKGAAMAEWPEDLRVRELPR